MKMPHLVYILLSTLCFYSSHADGLPSLEQPVIVTQNMTIELTENLTISAKGSPFLAAPLFIGTLTITSKNKSAVIISPTGIWDLSSFNGPGKKIEFRGNARLILQPGAHLTGSNTTLTFAETSTIE